MFGLGMGEIAIILFIILLFMGPKKLPQLAKGLGEGIRELKKSINDKDEPEVETKKFEKV